MKGINKLTIIKTKLAPILLSGTMALSLTSCGGRGSVDMSSRTMKELLAIEQIKNSTQLDELSENGELNYNDKINYIQAADKLEKYITRIQKIEEKVEFKGVKELTPLPEEELKETLKISEKDLDKLIKNASYDGDDLKKIEDKLAALKKLEYLKKTYKSWVNKHGLDISINIMMASVKAGVADELNVPYESIVIPPVSRGKEDSNSIYNIKVSDKKYKVSVSEEELWNTINYIYDVQKANLDSNTEYDTYLKAINFAKTTMSSGVNVKNNNLETQYSASYIKKHYLKK